MIHSYPFYIADWRMSSAHYMTAEARGIYRELLDQYYHDGTLVHDEAKLRAVARATDAEWSRSWPSVKAQFSERDGRLVNDKVESILKKLTRYHDARKRAGRASGRARKNRTYVEHMLNKTGTKTEQVVHGFVQHEMNHPHPHPHPQPHKHTDAESAVSEMLKRHPKKGGEILAQQALAQILASAVDPEAVLADILRKHAAWCESEDWRRDGGRYCPKLHNWLSQGGYLDEPPGGLPEAPAEPPAARKGCPLCEQWGGTGIRYVLNENNERLPVRCECAR